MTGRVWCRSVCDRESGRTPLGKPVGESPRTTAACPEHLDRPIGVDAIRPPAIRDVVPALRQLLQAPLKVVDGHGDRSRDVSGDVLNRRPGIENHDLLRAGALQEFAHWHGLRGAVPEVLVHQPVEVSEAPLGHRSNDLRQLEHVGIGKPVVHEQAVLPALNESGLPERLQVLRRVRQGKTDFRRERIHRPLSLRQEIQHLEAVRAGQRLAQPGELAVEAVLELPLRVDHHQVINILLDHALSSDSTELHLHTGRTVGWCPIRRPRAGGSLLETPMTKHVDLYDGHYGHLGADPQTEVRKETYGEDLGQASWITLDELRDWLVLLRPDPAERLLEVACGSGGVTCRVARETGIACVGVDLNAHGIDAAARLAAREGLSARVSFQIADASRFLPFPDGSFDVVLCNDSINHLPDRAAVLRDWHRILRPGGRILFTDPIVITGQLSNEEIRVRSSIGFFLFTPIGCNERLIEQSGFSLLEVRDATEAVASVSRRWRAARDRRRDQLVALESEDKFEGLQRFLSAVDTLASQRRLSRYVYVAVKPVSTG